ncbi:MAG TPA: SRPBCC domain-containing protein [Bryobacteraceae bacterium]|nr:SRPBCC domain-containing protein [Bryobacteraceae bacterium]
MSVKKEESGRRSISVEVEVTGTPEEVWEAIATGPGVSSWFVPTEVDEAAGTSTSHFGPGMDSVAKITAWDPPRRYAEENSEMMGPGTPPMATEWTVEARAGGKCLVRVVHSLFASTDDWDNQLESLESGWPAFFRILDLYLSQFRGQRCSYFNVTSMVPGPEEPVWKSLSTAPLKGTVKMVRDSDHAFKVIQLEAPAPGIALLNTCGMGAQVMAAITFYLYGEQGATAAARDEEWWQAWMKEQFPTPA